MRIAFLFVQLLIDHLVESPDGRLLGFLLGIVCAAWVFSASLQYLVG